jgi:hypothetical protein
MTFDTDLATTIDNFISENLAAVQANREYDNLRREFIITLTGTSGTANINVDGTDYLATFNTDLATTASDFVATHEANLNTAGFDVIYRGDTVRIKKKTDAAFTATITNASGDLDGTPVLTLRIESLLNDQLSTITSFANATGDLAGTPQDAITASQFHALNLLDGGTQRGHTCMGIVLGADTGWRNSQLKFQDVVVNIYKYKGFGFMFYPDVDETAGKEGWFSLDGVYVRDLSTGSGDNATVGLILAGNTALSNPKILDVNKFETTCDTAIVTLADYPYPPVHAPMISTINRLHKRKSQDNFVATGPPAGSNDVTEGYSVGSLWYDTVGTTLYHCINATATAAVWV